MRAIAIAMGVLMIAGATALPAALEELTGVALPEVAGSAAAVWCGPDETNCCGEPIRVPVLKKEVDNPIQC